MAHSGWQKGKILWFDDLSGDGMVANEAGENLYFHYTAIQHPKRTKKPIHNNKKVKFTLYENGYMRQVDKIIAL